MTENKVFEEKIEGTTNIESYKLVTNDLVREALENDKGQDAQLLSWEIKPFTKKGDNYASIVACIEVKYHKNETEFIDSFVAKINPLRPPNFDVMEIYAREPVILSSIIGGMNKQLANLKLNNIRTPKVLSRNNEKGKEVFIAKNLRNQGFKMHDRKIGLDLNHSLLVVNEIGRFHASSILFEEEIYPKTLSETFPDFKRNWMDPELSSFEILSSLFTEGAEKARNFAQKAGPKHEKGEKWLSKPSQEIINIYFDVFSPKKPFDVLIHGDCWTNNMLFKYNEDEIPVDIRFVDLEMAVKATPVADLLFFLYSSVCGNFRRQNMKTLLTAYYESFCDVLKRAGKKPPFTYMELKQEISNRKLFGFTCGVILLPFMFAEEDILDIDSFEEVKLFSDQETKKIERLSIEEEPINERYMALLDEMNESNLLDEYPLKNIRE